jgi:TrmH family RNA methyltransferase
MPPETIIRSRHNPIYKQIRSLLRRDRRHQERAFLVEGPRYIADAQRFGAKPQMLVLSETLAMSLDLPEDAFRAARIVDDELFSTLSDTVASQGMLGVFSFPDLTPDPAVTPFLVIADGIQDPGNLGTLIRSAAGAGATQIITLPGTVDPWSPKTVRAAAATHFIIPVEAMSFDALVSSLPRGTAVVGADAAGSARYDEIDMSGPLALMVGGEGAGLSTNARGLANQLVSIPLAGEVESLNAGVAGSILLFEASRQRRHSGEFAEIPNV